VLPAGAGEPLVHGERWFVGRHDVRDAILAFLDEPGRGHRLYASGTWGIGKTALVDMIEQEARGRANVLVVRCGGYVPRAAPTGSGAVSTMALLQNADALARLLSDLSDRVGTAGFGAVGERIVRARRNVAEVRSQVPQSMEINPRIEAEEVEVSDDSSLVSVLFESKEPLHRLEATIDEEREAVANAFASEVDRLAVAGGAVVLVDEFDHLRGHILANWLLELLARIQKAVIMLTTRAAGAELAPYRLEAHELRAFSADEVREYIGLRLGSRAVSEEIVTRVLRFSAGLPQAVGMAADLIAQRARTGGDQALGDIEFEDARPVTADLLSKIVGELDEPDVVKLLRDGRLARRIDLDLANWLLFGTPYEVGTPEAARASAAFEALKAYSFIEPYGVADFVETGRYRFHEYIRRTVPPPGDRALQVDEETVHETLAAFFEGRRERFERESDDSAYQQWFRNEDRRWQSLTSDWLYHCGMLRRPGAREAARLEMARTFLDAFWWWGCYIPFPFCAELLSEWELTQPESERAWSDALRELLRSYPLGYQKVDSGNLARVGDAMRTLRDLGDLGREVPRENRPTASAHEARLAANRRRVRALTSLFRAHSFRFRSGMADLALAEYEDALAYFADDVVAVAWTTFELAELKLGLGEHEGPLAGIHAAALVAREQADYELLANLHRLRGDVALAREADSAAIGSSSGMAVLSAFAFLLPMPDPYTQAFYREQRERLAARLVELARRRSAAEAEAAASRVIEELAPLRALVAVPDPSSVRAAIERDELALLAGLLTPPVPPVGPAAREDPMFEPSALRACQAVDRDVAGAELVATASPSAASPSAPA
jgi:hypothetical protein